MLRAEPTTTGKWKVTYLLNFGHPLHPSVVVTFTPATEVRVPFSLDLDQPTESQVVMTCNAARDLLAERGGRLDGTSPLAVVLPGLTEGTALLLAELHGRLGYFPRVVQLRKTEDGTFRLAGTLDLEKVRQAARGRR